MKQMEYWQKAFTELNEKLGNDVWGAFLELDDENEEIWNMVIYVNDRSWIDPVIKETKGILAGHTVKVRIFTQEQHNLKTKDQ